MQQCHSLLIYLQVYNKIHERPMTQCLHVPSDLLVKQGAYGEELTNDTRLESGGMIVVVFSEVF